MRAWGRSLSWIRTEQGRAWSQTCPLRPEPPLEPQGLISASLRLAFFPFLLLISFSLSLLHIFTGHFTC